VKRRGFDISTKPKRRSPETLFDGVKYLYV